MATFVTTARAVIYLTLMSADKHLIALQTLLHLCGMGIVNRNLANNLPCDLNTSANFANRKYMQ